MNSPNSIRYFSPDSSPHFFPNSNPMNLLSPPPVHRHWTTIRLLIPAISRNLAADFEAVAGFVNNQPEPEPEPEPRGDVIWRHVSIRLQGAGGEGEGEGEGFCGGLCVICQNEFANGERVGVLDCRHDYHDTCIHSWLMRRNICPLCQQTAIRELPTA